MKVFQWILTGMCLLSVWTAGAADILCTTLPITALTNAVVKGVPGFHVTQMLSSTLGCPHDYALTPQDMKKLAQADVIVINGLGMEDLLTGALPRVNRKALLIDSSKGAKCVLHSREHRRAACPDPAHHHHGHNHGTVWNEHLFSSPGTAAEVVTRIAEELARAYPQNADQFRTNAKRYAEELLRLDREYREFGKTIAPERCGIAVQHGVFDYLAAATGLRVTDYLQAHAGSEPSAAEIRAMIARLKQQKVALILAEKNYPSRVTVLVSRETGIPVVVLSVYPENQSAKPEDFLEVFRTNLKHLKAFYAK